MATKKKTSVAKKSRTMSNSNIVFKIIIVGDTGTLICDFLQKNIIFFSFYLFKFRGEILQNCIYYYWLDVYFPFFFFIKKKKKTISFFSGNN